jgi:D-alanyl-D-alanine carboxypeptidase
VQLDAAASSFDSARSRIAELYATASRVRVAPATSAAPASGAPAAPPDAGAATFTQALDGAAATLGGPPPSLAARRLAPGEFGPLQPPPELVPFGNGKVPAHTLAPLGEGNHRLWAPAAKAFREMRAAAARDNVSFDLTDSYRDLATQHDLVARKGLYSKGGLAAAPGTSNHGWGMAVDLDLDPRAQAWMRDNGWRFGFVEDTPREPWHWGFRPQGGTTSVSAWR